MTASSNLTKLSSSNGAQFSKFLQLFNQILYILEDFEDDYEKILNFTKLGKFLNIPDAYITDLASLILKTENIFKNVFKGHHLKKRKRNNILYLIAEKKIPSEIIFTSAQINLFSDLIYTFRYLKRGKGFKVSQNGTELLSNFNSLKFEHPYLFEKKDNGLIYPTSFGMDLGDLIISYNKGNKKINELTMDNYRIFVRDDE